MNCPSLTKVICEIPTAINKSSLFRATPIEEATLYVPEASLASYKTTSPWSDFGAILPISGAGIESISVGEPTIEAIYNLEGKRMNNMSRGLNILRMSDGTTKKVLNLREKQRDSQREGEGSPHPSLTLPENHGQRFPKPSASFLKTIGNLF